MYDWRQFFMLDIFPVLAFCMLKIICRKNWTNNNKSVEKEKATHLYYERNDWLPYSKQKRLCSVSRNVRGQFIWPCGNYWWSIDDINATLEKSILLHVFCVLCEDATDDVLCEWDSSILFLSNFFVWYLSLFTRFATTTKKKVTKKINLMKCQPRTMSEIDDTA